MGSGDEEQVSVPGNFQQSCVRQAQTLERVRLSLVFPQASAFGSRENPPLSIFDYVGEDIGYGDSVGGVIT